MEDHHVDRPGVEVRQRMKLTGTNSSIGLIILITHIHLTKSDELDLSHAPYRTFGAGAATARGTRRDGRSALRASPEGRQPPTKTNKKLQLLICIACA